MQAKMILDAFARDPVFSQCQVKIANKSLILTRGGQTVELHIRYLNYITTDHNDEPCAPDEIITRIMRSSCAELKQSIFTKVDIKHIGCQVMCVQLGASYTPIDSWDVPRTRVIVEKDNMSKIIMADESTVRVDKKIHSYFANAEI